MDAELKGNKRGDSWGRSEVACVDDTTGPNRAVVVVPPCHVSASRHRYARSISTDVGRSVARATGPYGASSYTSTNYTPHMHSTNYELAALTL
jgi:hypothetical protein